VNEDAFAASSDPTQIVRRTTQFTIDVSEDPNGAEAPAAASALAAPCDLNRCEWSGDFFALVLQGQKFSPYARSSGNALMLPFASCTKYITAWFVL
jgi:hypothetical protein